MCRTEVFTPDEIVQVIDCRRFQVSASWDYQLVKSFPFDSEVSSECCGGSGSCRAGSAVAVDLPDTQEFGKRFGGTE